MKVRLTVEETLKYQAEVIIEQPDTMSDAELEQILSKVERECGDGSADDVAYVLEEKYGIKVFETSTSFPDSPYDSELEITDVSEVKTN